MSDNRELDEEIVDQDRTARLSEIADNEMATLDEKRQEEFETVEMDIERQMADLEREMSNDDR